MVTEPATKGGLSRAFVALLIAAALLYLIMLWNAAAAPDLESIDKGVAAIYALISGVLLWIMLGVLLLITGARGGMPGWVALAAMVLHPLAGAAAVVALFKLSAGSAAPHWPIIPLIVLPLLVAFSTVWPQRSRRPAGWPGTLTNAAVWGSVFVVSVGLIGYVTVHDAQVARQTEVARREAAEAAATASSAAQQANADRLQRLTDASPLWDWQDFIGKGNALESQAVARVRALPHRQADAEAMLRDGKDFPLFHIRELDLHATPAFCAAASAFLTSNAAAHRAGSADDKYYLRADKFDPYLPAMTYLVGQHCDLASAIAAVEYAVRTYPAAARRDDFLRSLARLHPDWRACEGADNAALAQRVAGCTAVIDAGGAGGDDLAVARFNRGDAYLAQDKGEPAIQDYTAAIRLKPDFAEAFNNRGNAYDDIGAHDQALRDYNEALRINPAFAVAFSNRGLIYDARGDHDLAIADFDAALRLNPKYRGALKNRGRARFFKGDFTGASQDFAQALRLGPTDAYAVLWLELARDGAGQASQADLRRDAGALVRAEWPWEVVAVFLGEQDSAVVQAAARGVPDHDCDAGFYLGARAALQRDFAAARGLLERAEAVCQPNSIEYAAAGFALAGLPR